jgi:methyltransferase (TIGR00027 family)
MEELMTESKPSRTALSVAAHHLLLSYDPIFGPLVPKEAKKPIEWFISELSMLAAANIYLYRIPFIRSYLKKAESKLLPGFSVHIALRKHWIESQVKEAIDAGCEQVVVLGAGFDTLTYRLHENYPNVTWLEIDQAATQNIKKKALDRHTILKGNIYLTSADFTKQTLTEVLHTIPAFQPQLPTVYVAEGLLMYLPEVDVTSLFQQLSNLHQGHCQVIGTIIEPSTDGTLTIKGTGTGNVDSKKYGEPLLWGTSPVDLPTFLTNCDFQSVSTSYTQELLKETVPDLPEPFALPKEEYLFVAR